MFSTLFLLIAIAAYVAVPVVLIWGWMRWARSQQRGVFAVVSLISSAFGTASVLIALAGVIYGRAIGGFPYYDPRLMRTYRWGISMSLVGLGLAVVGIWRRSVLRWHAPALSFGMLLLWFVWASGE